MIRICRRCEHCHTALFGDSYCRNSKSIHNDVILEFYGTTPPMIHRVWKCEYFEWREPNENPQ